VGEAIAEGCLSRLPRKKSSKMEAISAALSGIPTPTPIAASLVEQLGHEAEGAESLDGLLVAADPATPPVDAWQAALEENVEVIIVVDVKTPLFAACVTTEVLVTVWVGSEKDPVPTEKPPPAEQQSSADWPRPQQN
jgi:hypothetical protein